MTGLPKGNFYYPLEVEQQLINCIKTGSFHEAKTILEGVFDSNFKKSILSVEIARCLMFDLVSTMIKTIHEINSCDQNFLENLRPVEKLLRCENVLEMKQEMLGILKVFCNHIHEQNMNRAKGIERQLVDHVTQYVDANYSDVNLGVTGIAEKFNVHLVHMSKVFKEVSGEGLLEYINRIRVTKAKELLKTSANLEEVAKQVGYTNIRTFSRVFKKYEGITAGKFKEMV